MRLFLLLALVTAPAAAAQSRLASPTSPAVRPPALPSSGSSERLVASRSDPWITPAERSAFATTPSYREVRAWLERLDAASPMVTVETFGRTGDGRDLLLVRASKGGRKPVVLVQAGIHSGEIDGKDAALMLLRDIALLGKDALLDRIDLVFAPILNIDGHEYAGWGRYAATARPQAGWKAASVRR